MTWLMILILALIVVIGIAAIPVFKVRQEEYQRTGKHPKGHYLGWGMVIGFGIGMPLGIATDNIALGPAMGLPIGVAIGAALEKKHEDELRPLTEQEEKYQKLAVISGVGLLIAGIVVFLAVMKAS